jgi:hypothetical protein
MMKTVLSIPLIVLIVFSGISISFASHYCGGTVAATRVSMTGELATCGMEKPSVNHSFLNIYTKKCCEDVVSAYSLCNNYLSSSSLICDPGKHSISIMFIPCPVQIPLQLFHNSSDPKVRPPGTSLRNMVSQPFLCIFLM